MAKAPLTAPISLSWLCVIMTRMWRKTALCPFVICGHDGHHPQGRFVSKQAFQAQSVQPLHVRESNGQQDAVQVLQQMLRQPSHKPATVSMRTCGCATCLRKASVRGARWAHQSARPAMAYTAFKNALQYPGPARPCARKACPQEPRNVSSMATSARSTNCCC